MKYIIDTDILSMFAKADALEMLVTFYIRIRQVNKKETKQ